METLPFERYFLIQKLLCEATSLLRCLFIAKYKKTKNQDWKDNKISGKYFETKEGKKIFNSLKLESQKKYLTQGDSNLWNLSIFEVIFSKLPFRDDSYEYIKSICEIRDELVDRISLGLSYQYFKEIWSKLLNSMVQLGFSQDKLNAFEEQKNKLKNALNNELIRIKDLAREDIKKENYDEAVKLYTESLFYEDITDSELSILYCNRSFAYYKLYANSTDKSDKSNLMKALEDALKSSNLNSKWYKPFARLGIIYHDLNKLEKSVKNFELALDLLPDDEELENLLSDAKYKLFEQIRLDSSKEKPKMNEKSWNEEMKFYYQLDDSFEDVAKGEEYYYGSAKIKKDYTQAAKYYKIAAAKGSPLGMYKLFRLYQDGLGVKQDYKMAFQLLNQASEKEPFLRFDLNNPGVAESEYTLGLWYNMGIYVTQDFKKALTYYELAIDHGYFKSANNLGLLYFFGKGVENDLNLAEAYFLWAYRSGSNEAITNLMKLYLIKDDPKKALMWHERGLEKDDLYHELNDISIRDEIGSIQFSKMFNWGLDNFFKDIREEIKDKTFFIRDPFRIHMIKTHRKNIHLKKNLPFFAFKSTLKPPEKRETSNSSTILEEIFLNEIDFTRDHVLDGFLLNGTIIDIPDHLAMKSMMFLIEDKKKNVERLAIYNLGYNFEQICIDYRIGTKISIINPYVRMANDDKPMIRVDDPMSIVIHPERIEKMCSYCGRENSKFSCSKCLKAFYCSKECQINDFKILKHKFICFI